MGVKRNIDEAGVSSSSSASGGSITQAETELYDRQIRLWGMECQKRLREARLLVVGLNGVGSEVVKNLALSGMKSITILDDTKVSESDRSAQFFCSASELGKVRSEVSLPAIKELNPNVQILLETGDPSSKPETFYANFEMVFATGLPLDVYGTIDKICRDNNVQFYCADTWGFYGYCFLDLNKHKYKRCISGQINQPAAKIAHSSAGEKPETMVEEELHYFPFTRTLNARVGDGLKQRVNKVFVLLHIVNHFRELYLRLPQPESHESDMQQLPKIRNAVCENLGIDPEKVKITDEMLSCVFGELSPVCAAVGGVLANEMIKGVTKTGVPVHNYFLFDGNECMGVNELIETKSDDEV